MRPRTLEEVKILNVSVSFVCEVSGVHVLCLEAAEARMIFFRFGLRVVNCFEILAYSASMRQLWSDEICDTLGLADSD